MTQPNDATQMELRDSSDATEPCSEVRPLGTMYTAAELSNDAAATTSDQPAAATSETAESEACFSCAPLAQPAPQSLEVHAAAAPQSDQQQGDDKSLEERDRFTLIGLAPVDSDAPHTAASATQESAAPADHALPLNEQFGGDDQTLPLSASQLLESSPDDVWEKPEERAPEPTEWSDGGESEWQDLSTKWVIAAGPQPHEVVDDTEVTNDLYWADRLFAGVDPRAKTSRRAPEPPPAPIVAQPVLHRIQVAQARAAQAPAEDSLSPAQAAPSFDARAAQQAPRRHDTLSGMSPLPEDWQAPADLASGEAARAVAASKEQTPWSGEEPSYSEPPRPRQRRPTWGSRTQTGAVEPLPPWAAMPAYAQAPVGPQQYAPPPWTGQYMPLPPWAAQVEHGLPPQSAMPHPAYIPPPAYPPVERRPTTRTDYVAPRRTLTSVPAPQRHPNDVITFEQLKSIADGWLGAVGKLAIAAFALHYSGLAVPLLAQFGYAPAPSPTVGPAPQVTPAEHATAPAVPQLAAAGVMGEPAISAARPRAEREYEADELEETVAARARRAARREASSGIARRSSPKQAHLHKSQAARRAAKRDADTASVEQESQVVPEAQQPAAPLTAAATEAEEAQGEAFLRINSRPWSQVFVDGTLVGTTPKIDLRVSPGAHRIRMVNTELGVSKTIRVQPADGETVSLIEQLEN